MWQTCDKHVAKIWQTCDKVMSLVCQNWQHLSNVPCQTCLVKHVISKCCQIFVTHSSFYWLSNERPKKLALSKVWHVFVTVTKDGQNLTKLLTKECIVCIGYCIQNIDNHKFVSSLLFARVIEWHPLVSKITRIWQTFEKNVWQTRGTD